MSIILTDTLLMAAIILVLYLLFYFRNNSKERDVSKLSASTPWWSLGLFIIAANISIDYVIGGAGQGFTKGIAFGSYEWTGCIFMVIALLFILPRIMSPGIKTIPEYLGYRYDQSTRKFVAVIMVLLQVFAVMVPVFYTATQSLQALYGNEYLFWLILISAIMFAILFNGRFDFLIRLNTVLVIILLTVGTIVLFYCFEKLGGIKPLVEGANGRLDSILPSSDDMLPWHSVFLGGLWVAHAYYWSFNQFIAQSVLQANNLSKAQFAYLFAATIKLLVPFLILLPGITVYVLYGKELPHPDQSLSYFLKKAIPSELSGKLLIGYLTTVIATFSSIMYSCVSMFMNDLYPANWTRQRNYKLSYRLTLVVLLFISAAGAYVFHIYHSKGNFELYKYNQYVMNAVTPTLVAVFGMGLFIKRITTFSANVALIVSIPIFILIRYQFPNLDLLNTGGIMFVALCLIMVLISFILPEKIQKEIPDRRNIRFERNLLVLVWSIFIITAVYTIYVIL